MERKCTNISSLFFCCGFVVLLFILVGYSGTKSDIERLTKGYDDCGNICGRKNKDLQIQGCPSGLDMSLKPKVEVFSSTINYNQTLFKYSCVERCKNDYEEVFNRCFKKSSDDEKESKSGASFFNELSEDLVKTWPKILITCFVAFIFAYIMLILFRYAIEYIIWIIYLGFVALLAVGAVACWILMAKAKTQEEKTPLLITAIMLSVLTVVVLLVLFYFRNRIKLVAQLFKEASKALQDVPSILFEPILTFISLMLAIVPFVFFLIVIQTAGDAVSEKNLDASIQVAFRGNGGIAAAQIINFIAFIWFTQFVLGCQHFVIGGTISKWYFIRDKSKLDSPVFTTFNHLVRFHLGSVCLGSMLITLVKIIQMIVNSIQKKARESGNPIAQALAACLSCLLDMLEDLLKYLLRNAYIIVAKDGTPLIESGRKAFRLIWDNLVDVIALNQFGDIVLVVARLFICAISTFIAYEIMKGPEIHNVAIPVVLAGIFSFLIAHCFITVFEMTVDTIFICFCDDYVENDGASQPYFMSPELMEIMRNLKNETGGDFNFGTSDNPHQRILPQDPQPYYPAPQDPQPYNPGPQDPYNPPFTNQPMYPPPQDPYSPPYPTQPMYPGQPQPMYPGQPQPPPQGGYYPPLPPTNPYNQQPQY